MLKVKNLIVRFFSEGKDKDRMPFFFGSGNMGDGNVGRKTWGGGKGRGGGDNEVNTTKV